MKTEEPTQTATVCASHRATIRCKYTPNTRTIRVSRFDGQRDPLAVVMVWADSLEIHENYSKAVAQYVARLNWGGEWVVSMVNDGAVAVCLDAVARVYPIYK